MSPRGHAPAIGVVVLVVVLAVLAGGWWLRQRSAPAPAAPATAVAPVTIRLATGDLAQAATRPLARTVELSGSVQALRTALLKAKVAAELRELTVREGEAVRAGQVIGRLDDTEFRWRLRQAEDQATSAGAQLEIAERTLANNRALVSQGFISVHALQTSESNVAGARATLAAARAAVELARKAVADTVLTAPIGGQIAQRSAQPGERVGVDGRIVEIVDLSALELAAPAAPADVASLRAGQAATLTVEGLADPVTGRVARIAPATQAGTRAVMVFVALDTAPGLRHGLFAQGHVEIASAPARVVPVTALRLDGARPSVLLVRDGAVRRVDVTPGERGLARFGGGPEPAVAVGDALAEGTPVLRGSVGVLADGTAVALP
jgi:RND family efflux transporter MFP subunit